MDAWGAGGDGEAGAAAGGEGGDDGGASEAGGEGDGADVERAEAGWAEAAAAEELAPAKNTRDSFRDLGGAGPNVTRRDLGTRP